MKKGFIALLLFMSLGLISSFAQAPPPPPENAGSGGGPVGGPLNGPIGSGVSIFLAFAAALAGWEYKRSREAR